VGLLSFPPVACLALGDPYFLELAEGLLARKASSSDDLKALLPQVRLWGWGVWGWGVRCGCVAWGWGWVWGVGVGLGRLVIHHTCMCELASIAHCHLLLLMWTVAGVF
jgi:hypothetical protein